MISGKDKDDGQQKPFMSSIGQRSISLRDIYALLSWCLFWDISIVTATILVGGEKIDIFVYNIVRHLIIC